MRVTRYQYIYTEKHWLLYILAQTSTSPERVVRLNHFISKGYFYSRLSQHAPLIEIHNLEKNLL
jgi:hypothetical protein